MSETVDALLPISGLSKRQELFPIREVSRLTGVNPVTLRAWERRYGLILPTRTDSGHRLYSQADVERVRSILAWSERGVAVSKVGDILARSTRDRSTASQSHKRLCTEAWDEWQGQICAALSDFDMPRLERLYGQIFSAYPLDVVFQDIFMPIWQNLAQHEEGFGRRSEWLLLDSFLRGRCLQRLQLSAGGARPQVLLAALPGHCRELELLVAALLLGNCDLDVCVFGVGQPLVELSLICEKVQPQALLLFSNKAPSEALSRQFSRLALTLECPLLLAGDLCALIEDSLAGSPIACLGSEGPSMRRRLQQFLAGRLDT